MSKFLAVIAAAAMVSLAAVGGAAAKGNNNNDNNHRGKNLNREGLACVVAGVTFLVENDLLAAAAAGQIDYDTIDSDSGGSEGLINTDLPPGSFLPLKNVIKLHYTNPELFDWCQNHSV